MIISNSDDAHVNLIAPLLKQRKVHVIHFDGDQLASTPCCVRFGSSEKNFSTEFISPASEVDVVWYRNVILSDATDLTSQFVRQETEGLLNALFYGFDHIRWVNNRLAIEKTRTKLHQRSLATQFGFRVPDSIFTNQHDTLVQFYNEHNGEIVAKPVQTQVISAHGQSLIVGTRRLQKDLIESAIHFFPCFAQERLSLKYEMRVVVFGERIYAFKLTPQVPADDLKQLKLTEILHEPCAIDDVLGNKIRAYMKKSGLEFGSFDFGVVDQDEPYFLELNPNGQWLWLQFMTGFDLITPFLEFLLM